MSNIIPLNNVTFLDLSVDQVLQTIDSKELDGIVIMGFNKEGKAFFKSTYADGGTVLWLMENLKKQLLDVDIRAEDK